MEQYTTATFISTTKLHIRDTGDYPVNIVERSSIPIASESDPRIKVFLKGSKGLTESGEGQWVDLGSVDGIKLMWGRDVVELGIEIRLGQFHALNGSEQSVDRVEVRNCQSVTQPGSAYRAVQLHHASDAGPASTRCGRAISNKH